MPQLWKICQAFRSAVMRGDSVWIVHPDGTPHVLDCLLASIVCCWRNFVCFGLRF